jgi:hypothetical protein
LAGTLHKKIQQKFSTIPTHVKNTESFTTTSMLARKMEREIKNTESFATTSIRGSGPENHNFSNRQKIIFE